MDDGPLLVAILVAVVMAFIVGGAVVQSKYRGEAIARGFAEYPVGSNTFTWKEGCEE